MSATGWAHLCAPGARPGTVRIKAPATPAVKWAPSPRVIRAGRRAVNSQFAVYGHDMNGDRDAPYLRDSSARPTGAAA